MTGPQELLLAYYRRMERENRELRKRNKALTQDNREVRASREKWKAKAVQARLDLRLLRSLHREQRERAEMWKARAMREQRARDTETAVLREVA